MARLVRNLGNLALLIGLALPFDANAGPVVAPGDVGLRHDIQVLADYGVIRGPVTTWPLAWDAIRADLSRARDEQMVLPVAVERTLERLLARAERESLRGRHRVNSPPPRNPSSSVASPTRRGRRANSAPATTISVTLSRSTST